LIELLIVCVIIPIIIGAISAGLLTILKLQSSVKARITDSSDAQVVSSTYLKDVQSATLITTSPSSSPQCPSPTGGTLLLGLQWAAGQTVVSYDTVPVTGVTGTTYSLVREYCTSGNTTTPSSTTTVAYDISGSQFPPCMGTVNCSPNGNPPPPGWIPAASVQSVKFVVNEAGTGLTYALLAYSRAWTPAYATPPNISVGPAFSPLTVLSSGNGLTLGNYSSVTVNPSPGTNGSSVAIASPNAGSVSIGTDATLTASTLLTTDPLLNSVSSSPPTEYYSPQVTDPLSGILSAPASPGNSPSCSNTPPSKVYTCPAGMYSSLPAWTSGSTITFGYQSPNATTEFTGNLTLPANSTVTFDYGTYIFDGPQAITGLTSGNTISTITGNNVLFYIRNGSVDFGSTSSVYLAPIDNNDGVTIWDATKTSTTAVNIYNIQGDRNSYGGIYVPGGTVNAFAPQPTTAALYAEFLIANTINVNEGTNVIVTGP
jgi:hypothetical protein